jgi:glycine/D-amino acid oxidase-like deaminating enzyme
MASAPEFVVLGAGVAGLTTATELRQQFPSARISVVAKYLPGFTSPTEYTSPWAGADWQSFEPEYNRVAAYDAVGYKKFLEIAAQSPESGVKSIPLRGVYDDAEMAVAERKIWYRDLVGGFKEVPKEELPAGAAVGLDWGSLIINTVHYLFW